MENKNIEEDKKIDRKEKNKRWREEKKNELILCECGDEVKYFSYYLHVKSRRHVLLLLQKGIECKNVKLRYPVKHC